MGFSRSVRIGSRILAAAISLEELLAVGATQEQAQDALRKDYRKYGRRVLNALSQVQVPEHSQRALLPFSKLKPGMVLLQDLRNRNGTLIVSNGHELTASSIARLWNHARLGFLDDSRVQVEQPVSADAKLFREAA